MTMRTRDRPHERGRRLRSRYVMRCCGWREHRFMERLRSGWDQGDGDVMLKAA